MKCLHGGIIMEITYNMDYCKKMCSNNSNNHLRFVVVAILRKAKIVFAQTERLLPVSPVWYLLKDYFSTEWAKTLEFPVCVSLAFN